MTVFPGGDTEASERAHDEGAGHLFLLATSLTDMARYLWRGCNRHSGGSLLFCIMMTWGNDWMISEAVVSATSLEASLYPGRHMKLEEKFGSLAEVGV